jgi:hypothetical protein
LDLSGSFCSCIRQHSGRSGASPFSDLDVAEYVALGLPEKAGLALELSLSIDRQMGTGPPCEVRIMNWLPLAVAGESLTQGILIYCRNDHARIDYETSIGNAYFDFLPSLRKFQKEYWESIMDLPCAR